MRNVRSLLYILFCIAILVVALLSAGCTPGLGRENPVPAPVPDHGANAPEAATREVVFYFDIMKGNEYLDRQVTGDVACQQANGRPANMFDRYHQPVPNPFFFNGRSNYELDQFGLPIVGGVEVRLTYGLGVVKCKTTAVLSADPGDTLFLTTVTGPLGFNINSGNPARGGQAECTVMPGASGCAIPDQMVFLV